MSSAVMTDPVSGKPDRGWLAMEVGIVLLLVMAAVYYAGERYARYLEEKEYQVIASHTTRVKTAAVGYIGRYQDDLLAVTTTTTPAIITPAMLRNTGFLTAGFGDTNSYGQGYQVAVVRNSQDSTKLEGLLVTTDGSALAYKALRLISQDVEGLGGYVYESTNATGAFGNWAVPVSQFGVSEASGHLAVLLTADELLAAREESDRLYRYQVNGRPDLNRMHTAIDMNGNSVVAANDVGAQTGTFGGDVKSTGGWFTTEGNKGWMNVAHGGGFYQDDNDWVKSLNGKGILTTGQVRGGTVVSEGRLTTQEFVALERVSVAGTACDQNGLLSRDNNGATLSCQSGMWTKMGGGINESTCQWISAPNKDNHGAGYKTAACPAGYVMAGTRWFQIPSYVDDEHVDAYCCQLN
ncbi:TPA: shufflon system plasmid conjugative transfer pilus tip adhesin PilV [Serratia fonticola]